MKRQGTCSCRSSGATNCKSQHSSHRCGRAGSEEFGQLGESSKMYGARHEERG
jgi:hypothetical protein